MRTLLTRLLDRFCMRRANRLRLEREVGVSVANVALFSDHDITRLLQFAGMQPQLWVNPHSQPEQGLEAGEPVFYLDPQFSKKQFNEAIMGARQESATLKVEPIDGLSYEFSVEVCKKVYPASTKPLCDWLVEGPILHTTDPMHYAGARLRVYVQINTQGRIYGLRCQRIPLVPTPGKSVCSLQVPGK